MTQTQRIVRDARYGRTAAVSALTLLTLVAATSCSQERPDEKPAKGIVLDLGGEIAVLEEFDSEPEIVGYRPEGTETLDTYRLTSPSQLQSGDIVGIRDGGAVAISPAEPGKATLLGQATAWFPGVDAAKVWTVTEQARATACPGDEVPTTVRARYTITEHETSGRPARRNLALPCGVQPVAQTTGGIVAQQTTHDEAVSGTATRARTSIVILDKSGAVASVIAKNSTVVAALADRIIWRPDDCAAGSCTKVYNTQTKKSQNAPACEAGDSVGTGLLAAGGRWYATTIRTGSGNRLGVLDLEKSTCRDLGPFSALEQTADVDQELGATWSGSNLFLLDQRTGELMEHNAPTGRVERRRQPLTVTNGAQVWGALKV
ncbi:hypothetical protein ACF064_16165 [Streptomyces sp. NPDC015492]|uniref:hypothetical protein n=1 Tax=unclassified Streptomyces TaxID=2593676 RepID=UPI003401250F